MKNFKLLLASTAILSMGAYTYVKAEELSWNNYTNTGINIPIEVRVVDTIKVAVERGINFGTVEYDSGDDSKYITVDKDGNVGGTAQYFGGAHTALIYYKVSDYNGVNGTTNDATKMRLELPTSVTLHFDGKNDETHSCGTVDSFEQKLGGSEMDTDGSINMPIYIGARYNSSGLSDSREGGTSCSGSIIATLVYYNN